MGAVNPRSDTTTAHGRLMLAVLGGLAEFERELISARNLLSYFSFFAT
jgi:DNA invertase Pin-like site-specific DNA recombinase